MGRKKIAIEELKTPAERRAKFTKRNRGIHKKARELAVLCGCDVALITFSPDSATKRSEMHCFSNRPKIQQVLQQFIRAIPDMPREQRETLRISQDIIDSIDAMAAEDDMDNQQPVPSSGLEPSCAEIEDTSSGLAISCDDMALDLDPDLDNALGNFQGVDPAAISALLHFPIPSDLPSEQQQPQPQPQLEPQTLQQPAPTTSLMQVAVAPMMIQQQGDRPRFFPGNRSRNRWPILDNIVNTTRK